MGKMSGRYIRSHLWIILSRYYGIDVHLSWAQQARAGYAAQAGELREGETSILDAAIIDWGGDLREIAIECNLRISRTPVDPSVVESVEVVPSTLNGPDERQNVGTGGAATATAATTSGGEAVGASQQTGLQPDENRDPRQQPNTSEAPRPPPDVPLNGPPPQVWRSPIPSETDFGRYLRGLLYNPGGHQPPPQMPGPELVSTAPELPTGHVYHNSGFSIDPPQQHPPLGQHTQFHGLLLTDTESAMEPHQSQRNFQVNIARVLQIERPEPPSTAPLVDLTTDTAPAPVSQAKPAETPHTAPPRESQVNNAPAPQVETTESDLSAPPRELRGDNAPIPPVDTVEPPTTAPSRETHPKSAPTPQAGTSEAHAGGSSAESELSHSSLTTKESPGPEAPVPASGSGDRRPSGEFISMGDPVVGSPKASYAQDSAMRSTVNRLADVNLPPGGTFPPWEPPHQSRAPPQIPAPASRIPAARQPPQLPAPFSQGREAMPTAQVPASASRLHATPQQRTMPPPQRSMPPPPPPPAPRPLPASDPVLPAPASLTRPPGFPRLDSSASKPPQEVIRPESYQDSSTEKLQDLANAAEIDWTVNKVALGYSNPPTPGLEGPGLKGLKREDRDDAGGSGQSGGGV
nr:hypothetical protein B0A51_01134 [Rachicladosporium sp. CCFEE 5018]